MFFVLQSAVPRSPAQTLAILFLSMLCTCMSAIDLLPKFINSRAMFRHDYAEGAYSAGES
jgi:hypothetical protein